MSASGVTNNDTESPRITEIEAGGLFGQSVPDATTRNIFQLQVGSAAYSFLIHVLVSYGNNTAESILVLVCVSLAPAVDTPAVIANTGTGAGGTTVAAVLVGNLLKIQVTNASGQQANVSASLKSLGTVPNT